MPRPDRNHIVLAILVAAIFLITIYHKLTSSGIGILWPTKSRATSDQLNTYSSLDDECYTWLQSFPSSIVYNYESEPGPLSYCINSTEGLGTRASVTEIQVALVKPIDWDDEAEPLIELSKILPNLESIKWPYDYRDHPGLTELAIYRKEVQALWNVTLSYDSVQPVNFPCTSDEISSDVSYGTGSGQSVVGIYNSLKRCPNIRSLFLEIEQGGCVIDSEELRSFPFQSGDKLPDLEKLTTLGYNWDGRAPDWDGPVPLGWWRSISSNTSAEDWKNAMDWSKLRHLEIDGPSKPFLDAFTHHLRNLTSLSFQPARSFWGDEDTLCGDDQSSQALRQAYTTFITSQHRLESLSISGTGTHLDLPTILSVHGPSLTSLTLHEFERDCAHSCTNTTTSSRPTISPTQLASLNTAAPHLRYLTLDLPRNTTSWPTSHFSALSKFPNLETLTLHFDLEDPSTFHIAKTCNVIPSAAKRYCRVNALAEPRLNTTSAQQIFRTLRDMKAESGSGSGGHGERVGGVTLQNLTLISGDFGRKEGGGLRMESHFEGNEPERFDCVFSQETGEVCEGVRGGRGVWWEDEEDWNGEF